MMPPWKITLALWVSFMQWKDVCPCKPIDIHKVFIYREIKSMDLKKGLPMMTREQRCSMALVGVWK
jgi:hypothetical protein